MSQNQLTASAHIAQRIAWAAFLLTLPITSFPFFPPTIGGEALVRPLSIYPLIILILLVVLPRLANRPLPRTLLPLLPFVMVAIAGSLLSLLRGIEPALGISVTARVFRGMFTLLIGCAIYLTISLLPETIDDLRFSLRWIYIGGSLALFWGSLQAIYIIHFDERWFKFLENIQSFISVRRLLPDRISGLTYEPHWFSDQITLLLIPWLLAAALTGYSVFHWRWRWLTVERLLLFWSILLLPFTFSRAGLLNLATTVFLGVLFLRSRKQQELNHAPLARTQAPRSGTVRRLRRALEVILAVLMVSAPIYLIGARNPFFARVWGYWQEPNANVSGYLQYLGFDARLMYSEAAFNTYLAYPILGVGLGNYAFYFEEMLPYRPIAEVPEALRMITPEKGRDRLITSKNFYLRLLAETGIVGAITFLAFVIAAIGCAFYLWLAPGEEGKYWGAASLCGLIAFALSALTFDSFVIPNMWIIFGMITAATAVLSRSHQG